MVTLGKRRIFKKVGMILLVLLGVGFSSNVLATTYNDFMRNSSTGEKPAQIKTEEETPVLVSYEVGDTSSFYTTPGKSAFSGDGSEWDDLDEDEYDGR